MISVRGYNKGDVYNLYDVKSMFANDPGVYERIESSFDKPSVFAKTLCDEFGIVAIFGGNLLWSGCMEIWSVTSNKVRLYPLSYTKACLQYLLWAKREFKIHRFQASGLCSVKSLEGWFATLGFHIEGTMEKYGPDGSDFYLYARTD